MGGGRNGKLILIPLGSFEGASMNTEDPNTGATPPKVADKSENKNKKWTWNTKQWMFLVLTLIGLAGFVLVGTAFGWWQAGVFVLSMGVLVTLVPIIFGALA
jgi:hypothetical protein